MYLPRKITLVLILLLISLALITYRYQQNTIDRKNTLSSERITKLTHNEVYITVVACGSRLEETLTMIKSAIIFNNMETILNFKIITEDILKEKFKKQLLRWQAKLPVPFLFELLSLHFPKTNEKDWRNLFKPCAAQRLFLPSVLHNVESTIYVDTDVVFLSPASDIWNHFSSFNSSHISGLSPEHEDMNMGWYNRFANHPFYGKLGVNSGVMLMNLTRMREFKWENRMVPIYKKYRSQITWGDQDLINILFSYHPDKLYIFPCPYNYRPDHCMYMNVCDITKGIRILHGNRGYFHNNKQPFFKNIYDILKDIKIEKDAAFNFNYHLTKSLETFSVKNSTCGKIINELGIFSNILLSKGITPGASYGIS